MVDVVPEPDELVKTVEPILKFPEEVIDVIKPFIEPLEPRLRELNTIATIGRKSLEPITTTLEAVREINYFLTSSLRIPYKIFHSIEEMTDVLLGKGID